MAVREGLSRALLGLCSQASLSADAADRGMAFEPSFSSLQFRKRELNYGGSVREHTFFWTMAVREGFEPSVPFWSTAL